MLGTRFCKIWGEGCPGLKLPAWSFSVGSGLPPKKLWDSSFQRLGFRHSCRPQGVRLFRFRVQGQDREERQELGPEATNTILMNPFRILQATSENCCTFHPPPLSPEAESAAVSQQPAEYSRSRVAEGVPLLLQFSIQGSGVRTVRISTVS